MLTAIDQDLRGQITRWIAAHGSAPRLKTLAKELGMTVEECERSLKRLGEEHALLLHPNTCRPWVVHPFALSAGSCWVETHDCGHWANCLYCAFGIAAAKGCDATIYTRYGGESEQATFTIRDGAPLHSDDVFHLSTPLAHWWDNVIAACASFQPFRSQNEAIEWCDRHRLPFGHVMTIPELWAFASDWYGSYLKLPWRKRNPEQVQSLLARHQLDSEFWKI